MLEELGFGLALSTNIEPAVVLLVNNTVTLSRTLQLPSPEQYSYPLETAHTYIASRRDTSTTQQSPSSLN